MQQDIILSQTPDDFPVAIHSHSGYNYYRSHECSLEDNRMAAGDQLIQIDKKSM